MTKRHRTIKQTVKVIRNFLSTPTIFVAGGVVKQTSRIPLKAKRLETALSVDRRQGMRKSQTIAILILIRKASWAGSNGLL